MPVYRFESKRSSATEVIENIELADNDAARIEALTAAKDALIDGILKGVDETDWVTRVYDEAGCLVATIAYADIVHGDHAEGEEPDEPGVMRSG